MLDFAYDYLQMDFKNKFFTFYQTQRALIDIKEVPF